MLAHIKMNNLKLTIGLFLITNLTLSGQTFTEDYFKYFSHQWETSITDSMRNSVDPKMDSIFRVTTGKGFWEMQQKTALKSTQEFVDLYTYIIETFGLSDEESFVIIEEKQINPLDPNFSNQVNCVLKTSSDTYYYTYDEYFRLLEKSEFTPYDEVLFEYFDLLSDDGFKAVEELASKEAESFNPTIKKNYEYQLISYDKLSDETIKVAYLHEKE